MARPASVITTCARNSVSWCPSDLTRDGLDQRGRTVRPCRACGRYATCESTSQAGGHRFPRGVILLAVRYYGQLGAAAERISGVLAHRGAELWAGPCIWSRGELGDVCWHPDRLAGHPVAGRGSDGPCASHGRPRLGPTGTGELRAAAAEAFSALLGGRTRDERGQAIEQFLQAELEERVEVQIQPGLSHQPCKGRVGPGV